MDLVTEPKIPTIVPVSRNFTPEKGIKIYCMVPSGASRFIVSLQCSKDIALQGDTALQVCFNLRNNNSTVSSRHNGTWDEERTIPGIPFKCGDKFQLAVACDFAHYKVFINGQQYCEFPQNIGYEHISYLAINGDVTVVQVSCDTEISAPTSFGFESADIPLPSYNEGRFKNDATVPLNAASPNFRQVPHSNLIQYLAAFGLVLIIIIVILCAVFLTSTKNGSASYDFD